MHICIQLQYTHTVESTLTSGWNRKETASDGCCLEWSNMQLLHGCFMAICMPSLCIFASFAIPPFLPLSFSNAKAPCLSHSLCSFLVFMYSQLVLVTAGSARLPQSIGHGWLANRSYTALKRQSDVVTWGMFTGCHIVCVCVWCCIQWH